MASTNAKTTWRTLSSGWRKWERQLLEPRDALHREMVRRAKVRADSVVLDIATGAGEPGLTAARIAASGKVIGADVSDEMLEIARERAARAKITNFRPQLVSEERLPFENAIFDGAFCCFGLEFVKDPAVTVREALRVLKPGNAFVVCTWGPEARNPFIAIPRKIAEQFQGSHTVKSSLDRFNRPDLLQALAAEVSGVATVEPFSGEFVLSSIEELWELKLDTSAHLFASHAALDEASKPRIRKAFDKECAPYLKEDGRVALPFETWITEFRA